MHLQRVRWSAFMEGDFFQVKGRFRPETWDRLSRVAMALVPANKRRKVSDFGGGGKLKASKANESSLSVPVGALLKEQVHCFDKWLNFGRKVSSTSCVICHSVTKAGVPV